MFSHRSLAAPPLPMIPPSPSSTAAASFPLAEIKNGYLKVNLGQSSEHPHLPFMSLNVTAQGMIMAVHTILGLWQKLGPALGTFVYFVSSLSTALL